MYTIITRSQCNFCDYAKSMLRSRGLAYTSYTVDSPSSKWLLTLIKDAGMTTVPQIFNPKGEHVGGYTELKELLNDSGTKEF